VGLGCVVAATGSLWPREGWRVRSARSIGTRRCPIHDPRHEMQRVAFVYERAICRTYSHGSHDLPPELSKSLQLELVEFSVAAPTVGSITASMTEHRARGRRRSPQRP